MAITWPELLTQADDLVAKLQNNQSITQPIPSEVIDAADKKINALSDTNKEQIRAALFALRTSTEAQSNHSTTLLNLKKSIESEISSPISVSEMKKLLDKLDTLEPDGRKVVVSYLWSKLAHAGYSMTIQNNKISLFHSTEKENAALLEATLSAYIDAKKVNLSEIQRAILMGSWSFGKFLDTQVDTNSITTLGYVNFLEKAYEINLSKGGSPAQKIGIINKTGATPAEKAFLISYVNGGYGSYNLVPDAERQKKLRVESKELFQSEEYKKFQWSVDTASGGAAQAERKTMQQGWKKEELTIDSFMDNPASAIAKYPWTSLALVGASIWKFGFGKTIFWILAAVLGLKAVNELWDTEMGRELKDNLKKWAKEAVGALWGAADKAKEAAKNVGVTTNPDPAPANVPALTPSQQKWVLAINSQKSTIESAITMRQKTDARINATLQNYTDYIHSQDLQNLKLSSLIFNSDNKISIFTESKANDFSNRPANLDPAILKRVMRVYLWIPDPTGTPNTAEWWKKEKEDFIKKTWIDEATWKDKTFSELITKIYT